MYMCLKHSFLIVIIRLSINHLFALNKMFLLEILEDRTNTVTLFDTL